MSSSEALRGYLEHPGQALLKPAENSVRGASASRSAAQGSAEERFRCPAARRGEAPRRLGARSEQGAPSIGRKRCRGCSLVGIDQSAPDVRGAKCWKEWSQRAGLNRGPADYQSDKACSGVSMRLDTQYSAHYIYAQMRLPTIFTGNLAAVPPRYHHGFPSRLIAWRRPCGRH